MKPEQPPRGLEPEPEPEPAPDAAVQSVFAAADSGKSSQLDRHEVANLMEKVTGKKMTADELDVAMREMDADGSGDVDIEELQKDALAEQVRQSDKLKAQVDQLFKQIDTDKSGRLDRNEVATAILFQTGKYLSEKEVDQAMQEMDADGSGDVNIEEFQLYMAKKEKDKTTALAVVMNSKLADQVRQNSELKAQVDELSKRVKNKKSDGVANDMDSKLAEQAEQNSELKAQVDQLFKEIDRDNSGKLNRNEVGKAVLAQTGKSLSEYELHQAMKEIDTDDSGDVDIKEFQAYMANKRKTEKTALAATMDNRLDRVSVHSRLFKKIDTDHSGALDRDEVAKAVLVQTGKYLSEKELDEAMKEIDTDGSGDVDIEEFQAYMIKTETSQDTTLARTLYGLRKSSEFEMKRDEKQVDMLVRKALAPPKSPPISVEGTFASSSIRGGGKSDPTSNGRRVSFMSNRELDDMESSITGPPAILEAGPLPGSASKYAMQNGGADADRDSVRPRRGSGGGGGSLKTGGSVSSFSGSANGSGSAASLSRTLSGRLSTASSNRSLKKAVFGSRREKTMETRSNNKKNKAASVAAELDTRAVDIMLLSKLWRRIEGSGG